MVVRHPDTARPVLFVNRLMTRHVVGMDPAAGSRLLERLFAHMEQPQFIYEHAWRKHDLLIWDNRAVLHARNDWDPEEARVMRRVSVQGTRPVAAGAAAG
jgi:taurine dioxygenase